VRVDRLRFGEMVTSQREFPRPRGKPSPSPCYFVLKTEIHAREKSRGLIFPRNLSAEPMTHPQIDGLLTLRSDTKSALTGRLHHLERKTRFDLATFPLARRRSTRLSHFRVAGPIVARALWAVNLSTRRRRRVALA